MPDIYQLKAVCPACGSALAMSTIDGEIICNEQTCKRPTAASELLNEQAVNYHIVKLEEDGWTTLHPIIERLDRVLFDCPVDATLVEDFLVGQPIGHYKIDVINNQWHLEPIV